MVQKTLTIYIGGDLKPYSDKELTMPLAQVSDKTYVGENNSTIVLFDLSEFTDFGSAIANIKKPDGTIHYTILEKVGELYKLDLESFYTNQKGALIISVNIYEAGLVVVDENTIELNGDEMLLTTAPIKLYINYTPFILPSGKSVDITDLQRLLYALSYKIDKSARINGKEITPTTELFGTDILVEQSGVFDHNTIDEVLYLLENEKVGIDTLINGKPLSSDIVLDSTDIKVDNGNTIEQEFNYLSISKANQTDLLNAVASLQSYATSQAIEKALPKLDKKPNGVDDLIDNNDKLNPVYIPDSVLGQLEYMGTFSGSTLPIATEKGQYWVYNGVGATIGGIPYMTGDWAVFNGVSFDKIDNTDAVQSVAGKTGAVVLNTSDIVGLSDITNTLVPITYSALKTLRDTSKLVVGRRYRITDYETTTIQEDTQSAGNVFDIIVLATATNKLSEKASAIQRVGTTYFNSQRLEAWQVWYSLDNTTSRFAWADSVNGKGVIYRLIDERFNDLQYDFKNIQFKRYKITEMSGVSEELETALVGQYYGIKKTDSVIPSGATLDENDFIYAFTFQSESATDRSLATASYNNSFGLGVDNITLGNNVFFGNVISGNNFSGRFYDNSFGLGQHYAISADFYFYNNVFLGDICLTTIGNSFYSNTIGNYFNSNTIGNSFYSNTIGNSFYSNTIGNNFNSNTIGNNFNSNTIGNYFYSNTIGNSFYSNTIGNYFNSNTIGNSFYSNTIGNYFYSNTIGNNFNSNTIGNSFYSNTIGNYFNSNTIGSNVFNLISTNNNRAMIIGDYVFGCYFAPYSSRGAIGDYSCYLELVENLLGFNVLPNTRGSSEENRLLLDVGGTTLGLGTSKTYSLSDGAKQFVLTGFNNGQELTYTKTLGTELNWLLVEEEIDGGTF